MSGIFFVECVLGFDVFIIAVLLCFFFFKGNIHFSQPGLLAVDTHHELFLRVSSACRCCSSNVHLSSNSWMSNMFYAIKSTEGHAASGWF